LAGDADLFCARIAGHGNEMRSSIDLLARQFEAKLKQKGIGKIRFVEVTVLVQFMSIIGIIKFVHEFSVN
jgi:hypothetical protein